MSNYEPYMVEASNEDRHDLHVALIALALLVVSLIIALLVI